MTSPHDDAAARKAETLAGPSHPSRTRLARPDTPGLAAAIAQQPATAGLFEHAALEPYRQGRPGAAMRWLARAAAIASSARLLGNLGVVAWQAADPAAGRFLRRALALDPAAAAALNSLGVTLLSDDPRAAARAHRHALALDPVFVEALLNLAGALRAYGKRAQSRQSLARALALQPAAASGLAGMGTLGLLFVDHQGAAAWCRRAQAASAEEPVAHAGLIAAHVAARAFEAALGAARRATALLPTIAALHVEHGGALQALDRMREAERAYRRAIACSSEDWHGYNALARLAQDKGEIDRAIALFRIAIERAPADAALFGNLLFALCFTDTVPPAAVYAEHRRFEARFAAPLRSRQRPHDNPPDPERRLRVAYLSPDFRRHPGGYFFEAFLANHDRRQVEVVGYSASPVVDDFTRRLAPLAQSWTIVDALDDEALAARIRADRIDILVECAGHMAGNRMLVFARKPAPVQVSFPLYPNTTGLDAMDYRIMDPHFAPPGAEAWHSEILARLPDVHVCYTPGSDAPPPAADPPSVASGIFTLGCFNNYAKVRDPVVALWTRILRRLPEARLVLKWYGMGEARPDWVHARFAAAGLPASEIAAGRIVTRGFDRNQYDGYLDIDLTLDPFPANGGTTSCDSLWMGVPVVTLAGETPFSRVGLCHLTNLGLPELVTRTPEAYEDLVVALARDPQRLRRLRSGLRQRMAASPLVDGPRYTRHLEAAYRTMWRRWCRGEAKAAWPMSS
jgi:protein O-GlcNAc transferase